MSCAGLPGPDFPLFVGDLLPTYVADARTCDGVFDFTGWTLTFTMYGPVTVTGSATGDDQGVITHEWVDGETDVPGEYAVVIVGISPGGRQRTFVVGGTVTISQP